MPLSLSEAEIQMLFTHGFWKCSCGYKDYSGYPIHCVGCGKPNPLDGKGNPLG